MNLIHNTMKQPKIKFFTYLNESKQIVKQILNQNPDFVIDESAFDFLIVLGGDGTFVSALNKFKFKKVKIILLNIGHLGFLSSDVVDWKIDLNKLKFETYPVLELQDSNKKYFAINEFICCVKNTSVNINVSINNSYLYTFFGSGFTVNSSIGSTGYSRSISGPMLKSKWLYNFAEMAPSLYTNTKSLLQNLVLDKQDEINIKIDSKQAKTIKIDGQTRNFNSTNFTIRLIESKAQVVDLFDNQSWANRIKRTIIGE